MTVQFGFLRAVKHYTGTAVFRLGLKNGSVVTFGPRETFTMGTASIGIAVEF